MDARRWCWLGLCFGLGCGSAALAEAGGSKDLYSRAQRAFQSQRWEEASRLFRRLLPALAGLQKKRSKRSRSYHLMTLGRCDVLFHLAESHWKRKRYRASCRYHQRLARLRRGLPSGWRGWGVHPLVPVRLARSAQTLAARCPQVPSRIELQLRPRRARVRPPALPVCR